MKKETILQSIAGLLILIFFYTALSKILDFARFRFTLRSSPLLSSISSYLAWLIPISEFFLCLLLILPRYRPYGFWGSSVLMLLFTLYISYMLATASHLPCSCGGVLGQMTWKQHLIFNITFTLLASSGIFLQRKQIVSNN